MRIFVSLVLFLGCVGMAWGHGSPTVHAVSHGSSGTGLTPCEVADDRYETLYQRHVEGSDRHWHFDFDTDESDNAVYYNDDCGDWSVGSWKSIVVEAYEQEEATGDPGTDGSYYPCAGDYPCPTDDVDEDTDTVTPTEDDKPKKRRKRSRSSTTAVEETLNEVVESSNDYYQPDPPKEYRTLPLDPEPEPEPIVTEIHEIRLFAGYTLVGFPVHLIENRTIEEIYRDNSFFDSENEGILIHLPVEGLEQEWYFYNGEGLFGNLPIPLDRHFGMVVNVDEPEIIELEGVKVHGQPIVSIRSGINLIGLPEVPDAYKVPSDFLIDGICSVIITNENGFQAIGRPGDSGDTPLYAGQGVILHATKEFTIDLSGSVAAGPMAPRIGNLVTTWGEIKVR